MNPRRQGAVGEATRAAAVGRIRRVFTQGDGRVVPWAGLRS